MPIRVALNHVTTYRYDRPVMMSPQVIRLRPAPHARTPIVAYSLKVEPKPHFVNWQQDPYANYLARVIFPEPLTEFRVAVDLIAEMTVINPFDFFLEAYAETYPFVYDAALKKELAPYMEVLPSTPKFTAFAEKVQKEAGIKGRRTIDVLVEANQRVRDALRYDLRMEPGVQTPEETLTCEHGSCRDFTWMMVQLSRRMGFAARFVSGYSIQLVADVKALDGPSGVTQDITDLHAWTEIYVPGAGWIGLDSTSGLLCGEGHIPLAATADPGNAAPIAGGFAWVGEKGKDFFDVKMSVTRVHEDPRVTKPYTREQWKEIAGLGHLVDERLKKGDVRLTMGGEPTFVSIDDMEGAEWNTEAMGPNKRRLSGILIKRLRDRFAPGAFMHFGQGKWYPGESLPRWALSCYWRKDGIPMWTDPDLVVEDERNLGHTDATAQRFITELAIRLGGNVHPEDALPAYEDVWHQMLQERKLPVNVDPLKSNLKNVEDRKRLAKVFEQGLDKVVGYILPMTPLGAAKGGAGGVRAWKSGRWFVRDERLYLIPGDSPMGFRLPLDSIPWVAPKDFPVMHERDPLELLPALPDPRARQLRYMRAPESVLPLGYREQEMAIHSGGGPGTGTISTYSTSVAQETVRSLREPEEPVRVPKPQESATWVLRTALCVEARDGVLHVFMPPVREAEDYLDLLARIEETASDLKTPVIIEGYTPPHDSRINVLKTTPDPGVIEVNTQPVSTWDEAVSLTTGLYEDAHQSRLGTEKFMIDGRHTGTGGGNHIVMGGPTPHDSPFLRRPDLLKSLVGYWHNHPSLSYLFSGMFIGPTSQAPRVDEGRWDNTYELEIAMRQVPDRGAGGGAIAPWVVDRIFRNLLVDLTGNTHRAEFCIDKLYSPDSSSGRLGLLEFRGFEMPPHAEMSLTQQLLLRALVARFWDQPYKAPLVRWGNQLHDRFLLPHFVADDFQDVLRDTQESGFTIKAEWFAPHFEFRFPVAGVVELATAGGMQLELRQAIEPWNVLGEEPAGGGTARFVDSSVERLQLKVTGMIDSRHTVAVNGIAVPLHSTGRNGEFVAGVRYRAWQPPACLHPTIGVHSPLVFDVVDTWNGRAVGGCSYHVTHPGGRSFETIPVNAFEAESRRVSRFFKYGHTPGAMKVKVPERSREFPLTLDLRRV